MIRDGMTLPDFIVVGAMKSGTTTLDFHLGNHPDISVPSKEVHFFDRDDHFSKGVGWYSSQLESTDSAGKIIGEKTPTYHFLPKVPKRISQLLPEVKLIWIFRNPVDRTYSNYLHALKKGVERRTFEQSVKQEMKGANKHIFKAYLSRSIYHEQVVRFLHHFSMDQMHFMLFEDLVSNTLQELEDIFSFLGLTAQGFQLIEEKRNTTVLPRYPKMLWAAKKMLGEDNAIYKRIKSVNFNDRLPGYDKMSPQMRQVLNTYFKPHNTKLAELTRLETNKWDI